MSPRAGRRSACRWLILLGVVGVLAVWGVLVARSLTSARRHTDRGIELLRAAQNDLTVAEVLDGEGGDDLERARVEFAAANRDVDAFFITPVRWLPFVGRQIESVDALTASAETVVEVGRSALDDAQATVTGRRPEGRERVEVARAISGIAGRAQRDLQDVDLGPSRVIRPLADARDEFAERLGELRTAVDDLAIASDGLARFLRGPSRYLVFAANNAEMRVGSGTFLSVGVLTVRDGALDLSEMRSVLDFPVAQGAVDVASVDVDLDARWGFLDSGYEWRSLGSSPRFDVNAELARAMWKQATGEEVDGVLALDVVALSRLLATTGPVQVDGREITPQNVIGEVLLEQYRGLEGHSDQQERRDRLAVIARAVINEFERGGWQASDLVRDLKEATVGRHVLAWSARPAQQAAWEAISASGALPADHLLVGVHNFGANKLDQFLSVDAAISTRSRAQTTEVTIDFTLRNSTPTGLPQYVAGPVPSAKGSEEGKYQGPVVVELPGAATDSWMAVDGRRTRLIAAGSDGPDHRVVAAYTSVRRGETRRVTLHFQLPAGTESLVIAPSARIPPIAWTAPGQSPWSDTRSVSVDLP